MRLNPRVSFFVINVLICCNNACSSSIQRNLTMSWKKPYEGFMLTLSSVIKLEQKLMEPLKLSVQFLYLKEKFCGLQRICLEMVQLYYLFLAEKMFTGRCMKKCFLGCLFQVFFRCYLLATWWSYLTTCSISNLECDMSRISSM